VNIMTWSRPAAGRSSLPPGSLADPGRGPPKPACQAHIRAVPRDLSVTPPDASEIMVR
jgi:hypothetical protein